jgi:hypothetical protein
MMQKQKDMERSMLIAHRQFVTGLDESMKLIEDGIGDVADVNEICTDEWCRSTEDYIDWLHKSIYAISEPRWADEEDSQKIHDLRDRVHNLYTHVQEKHH